MHLFICATRRISGVKENWKTVGKSTFFVSREHQHWPSVCCSHPNHSPPVFIARPPWTVHRRNKKIVLKLISKRMYSGIHKEFTEVNSAVRRGDFKNPCCVHAGLYCVQYMYSPLVAGVVAVLVLQHCNPFTAPAYNSSRLKSAHVHTWKQNSSQPSNKSPFIVSILCILIRVLSHLIQRKKTHWFKIWDFYWLFSGDRWPHGKSGSERVKLFLSPIKAPDILVIITMMTISIERRGKKVLQLDSWFRIA